MAKKKAGKPKTELITNQKNVTLNRKAGNFYPKSIKITCLAYYSLGYTMDTISKNLSIPKSTIHGWVHGSLNQEGSEDRDVIRSCAEQLNEQLQSTLTITANRLFVQAMDQDKIDRSSTKDLIISASVALDKARLLAGASTENHSHFHWSRNKKDVSKEVDKDEELLRQIKTDIQSLNQ
tara:strand:- start:27 stop:563 length:537 start_codon:yes stop_codon:yes gene_type:complete